MVKKIIINNITSPVFLNVEETEKIEKLTKLYPYFQTAQILYAKGLLDSNSILYNRQLKKAALYSIDRKKLFSIITKKIEEKTSSENKLENNKIGSPLTFHNEEMHSFSEWLSISKIKKINRSKDNMILDNFIKKEKNRNISTPNSFFKPLEVAKESLIENEDLVTPTLAKVYLEQKHYEKAIKAYKKLILKYPEKNSLFASQIKIGFANFSIPSDKRLRSLCWLFTSVISVII